MYAVEKNVVNFNLENNVCEENKISTTKRISDLHDFHMNGINFRVARTIFPLKFRIYASESGEIDFSQKLDLEQIQEYILTGKENDFTRDYWNSLDK